MKNIGLIIAFLGIAMLGSALIFTPPHTNNPADSISGIDFGSPFFYSGIVIFGIGIILFANAVQKAKGQHNFPAEG